jgi:hypothetical protein
VLTLTNTANAYQGFMSWEDRVMQSTSYQIKAQMRTAITSGGTIHGTIDWEDLT